MHFLFVVFAGALPALVAMWYFDRLDRQRPEPPSTLRRVAIMGAVVVFPCALVELWIAKQGPQGGYAGALFTGFVVAASVEELAKVWCMWQFAWKRPEFDERMDGIVYATRAGLGFALLENVLYLMQQKTASSLEGLAIVRALLAVPGHAIYAGIMGYFAARRRFDKKGPGVLGGYLIAVALHGGYDAAIFAIPVAHGDHQDGLVMVLVCVPVAIVWFGGRWLRRLARQAVAADDAAEVLAATQNVVPPSAEMVEATLTNPA